MALQQQPPGPAAVCNAREAAAAEQHHGLQELRRRQNDALLC